MNSTLLSGRAPCSLDRARHRLTDSRTISRISTTTRKPVIRHETPHKTHRHPHPRKMTPGRTSMIATGGRSKMHPSAYAALLPALLAACNGQFEFDTTPLDAGDAASVVPDVIVTDDAAGEAAIDASKVGIVCGQTTCPAPFCCGTSQGFACIDVAKGGSCGGILIQCDDTADCPAGQVCCAEGNGLSSDGGKAMDLDRVHCETEAHCRASQYVILCDPDRPSPCSQCVASSIAGLPPGYHQCAATP
jgi:hypothetical protein